MPRPASSAERGYGAAHQAERRRWAPLVDKGTVNCWRCGWCILPGQAWDLGHNDHDRTRYNGPEHTTCNRSAGAVKGNRGRKPRGPDIPPELRRRRCEICGAAYRARYPEQRACSQACGVEVARRNRLPAKAKPLRRRPMCSECGQQFILPPGRGHARRLTCGPECAAKRQARLNGTQPGQPRTYTCRYCSEEHQQQPGPGRTRTTCDACLHLAPRGTRRTTPPLTPPATAARW